jgi:hypothetical protein
MRDALSRSLLVVSGCIMIACSKSAANSSDRASSGGTSAEATHAHVEFARRGAGACDKYLTADVVKRILGTDVDERKTLSSQSCTVRSTKSDGELTITLKDVSPKAFHDFREFLSDPQSLAGVGDSAMTSTAPTVTAIKGTMGCDFDASRGSSPAALSGAARNQALGELCNKIFADAN